MTKANKSLSHAARVLRLRELLDARPFVTIQQLQDDFEVSRKTVYNDLTALQDAGVPVHSLPGPDGQARWQLQYAAQKKTITLTVGQVMPLGLARQALSFLEGTEVHDELSGVIDKLAQGAAPLTQKHLAELSKKVTIVPHGPKSYRAKADVLDDIFVGLLRDQLVEIRYRAPGKKHSKKHVIAPLSLVLYREALYLVADSQTFDGLRISFAVDRITSSKWLKGQGFSYPADYDPNTQLDGAFGLVGGDAERVEILFEPQQAKYVRERQWHPTQAFEDLPDGRVRMTMTVSGTHDVALWLLGHTGTFEVVAPATLRTQVRAALKTATARHKATQRK